MNPCKHPTRILTPLFLALALSHGGCDALRSSPGHDFGVTLLTPAPIVAIGKISVPVDLAITGCEDVDAAVLAGGAAHAIELARRPDGTFRADIPVEWLRDEDRTCLRDARSPQSVQSHQLTLSCRGEGRGATLPLDVSYGTATRAHLARSYVPLSPRQFLFASGDPLAPYGLAPSLVQPAAAFDPLEPLLGGYGPPVWFDPRRLLWNADAAPRLAATGSALFLSAGCIPSTWGEEQLVGIYGVPACPAIELAPSVVTGTEALWGRSLGSDGPRLVWWPVWVPAPVHDMAYLSDGTLLVLSLVPGASGGGSAVSRVTPDFPPCVGPGVCTPGATVEVIAYFPREVAVTRFSRAPDGRLAFASVVRPSSPGPYRSVLHHTDGRVVVTSEDPAGALDLGSYLLDGTLGAPATLELAPDASAVFVGGRYLGPPGGPFEEIAPAHPLPGSASALWLDGAFAVVRGASAWIDTPLAGASGRIDVHEAKPPHARRFSYEVQTMAGTPSVAVLRGATAVGDNLVLTTGTGIRILDRDGKLVGGSDPLPCGLAPTSLPIRAGPTTAAVRADSYTYVFDLAELPREAR